MNLFTCTTRLYKDAEQRYTQGGDSIVSFKGAVDSGYGQNKATTWIKFTLFGKRGESLLPYLTDKTQVAVSGELTNREYTDKEGQKRYALEVRVNDVTLLGGNRDSQQQKPVSKPAEKPAADIGDDIPF